MLHLAYNVRKIIRTDECFNNEINRGWILNHSRHTPEWYEKMDFVVGDIIRWDKPTLNWRIYADALREFGVVYFTEDLTTGIPYQQTTRDTVKTLIAQHGLRNVTNEFAKQIAEIYKKDGRLK